jgi:competence protein ComEA
MDIESLFAQYSPILRKYWLPLALFSAGLMFFVYGLIWLLGSASKQPEEITFQQTGSASTSLKTEPAAQSSILVDVEGSVVAPGVYKLTQDSIIQDALVSSGGLSANADREYVSKNINLAAKLSDGAKVYIPKIGETAVSAIQTATAGNSTSSIININTASSDALDALPGIGPVTAGKIINNRPYTKINDLLDKKVVSSKVFSQIKDKISVY